MHRKKNNDNHQQPQMRTRQTAWWWSLKSSTWFPPPMRSLRRSRHVVHSSKEFQDRVKKNPEMWHLFCSGKTSATADHAREAAEDAGIFRGGGCRQTRDVAGSARWSAQFRYSECLSTKTRTKNRNRSEKMCLHAGRSPRDEGGGGCENSGSGGKGQGVGGGGRRRKGARTEFMLCAGWGGQQSGRQQASYDYTRKGKVKQDWDWRKKNDQWLINLFLGCRLKNCENWLRQRRHERSQLEKRQVKHARKFFFLEG